MLLKLTTVEGMVPVNKLWSKKTYFRVITFPIADGTLPEILLLYSESKKCDIAACFIPVSLIIPTSSVLKYYYVVNQ